MEVQVAQPPRVAAPPSRWKHMLAKGGFGREVRDAQLPWPPRPGGSRSRFPLRQPGPGGSRSRVPLREPGLSGKASQGCCAPKWGRAHVGKRGLLPGGAGCPAPGPEKGPGGRIWMRQGPWSDVVVPPHQSLCFWSVHIAYCAHSWAVGPPRAVGRSRPAARVIKLLECVHIILCTLPGGETSRVRSGPWGSRWLAGLV